jgi:hypothetical protein
LNGSVPSNVKRMCLLFKISKIHLEYVAIFLTEIPQCLQRRHWGFLAFVFFCLMCTKMYLNGFHGNWINIVLRKNHLYIPFYFLFWNHERHDQRNPVTTALGAKQEGLTIVHFWNKLIVSCKETVRFPLYFFIGGGGGIFKLDSYFFFKLKGCFLYFTL